MNGIVGANYPSSINHPLTQNSLISHTMAYDHPPSCTANSQGIPAQQMLKQPTTANTYPPLQFNHMYPVNFNVNGSTQQHHINHYPHFTTGHFHPTNTPGMVTFNQQPTTSGHLQHTTNVISQHHLIHNETAPMESSNGNDFILVNKKRKNKKARINSATADTPDNDTSPCTNISDSTSSTNTDSIVSNVHTSTIAIGGDSRSKTKTTTVTTQQGPNNDQTGITQQAKRFAETRFAFPPFVIKFNQLVNESTIIKSLKNHFSSIHRTDLNLAGHRLKNKNELLLFSANRETFIILFDQDNWPDMIDGINYRKNMPQFLPPQFSIILRNVPTDIDIDTLLADIKFDYPDVMNAHRITGMNNKPSSFVRLDIKKVSTIEELLNKKCIYYENLRLPTAEYLAPAKVLVCSKCFEIGHFRGSCKSEQDHCRKCGVGVADIKQHLSTCTNKICCIRCKGDHEANNAKCPTIKSYRTILTKSLLVTATVPTTQQNSRKDYHRNKDDFPVLNGNLNAQSNRTYSLNNNTNNKIDELFNKMKHLDDNMNRLIEFNNKQLNQITCLQQVSMKHEHQLQLIQMDTSFHHEFTSQFLSPICQAMIDVLPTLVKQIMTQDNSVLSPSLTTLCEKLSTDLPTWTSRFQHVEMTKVKLLNDFSTINSINPAAPNMDIQINPVNSNSTNNNNPQPNTSTQ